MSYCRWSSNNWRCDLYVYNSSSGGYTTHVAARRVVGDIPPEPLCTAEALASPAWFGEYRAVMDFLATCERAPIGLAHDGASFTDSDAQSCLETLQMLRAAGYLFPDYVLQAIRDEAASPPEER